MGSGINLYPRLDFLQRHWSGNFVPENNCKRKKKLMNKLLDNISWSTYLEMAMLLTAAYYGFIGWKYYRRNFGDLIRRMGREKSDGPVLPVHSSSDNQTGESGPLTQAAFASELTTEQSAAQSSGLIRALIRCIASAASGNYATAKLITQLKKILNDYPEIAASPAREQINTLIVRECEENGTAMLSESEVDEWWSA